MRWRHRVEVREGLASAKGGESGEERGGGGGGGAAPSSPSPPPSEPSALKTIKHIYSRSDISLCISGVLLHALCLEAQLFFY